MPRSRRVWTNVFLGFVGAVCAFAIWSVVDLPWRARIFPQTVAGIGLIVTGVTWLVAWRAAQPEEARRDEATGEKPARTWPYLVWAGAYLLGIAVAGIPVASAVWVALFLRREDNMPWHFAVAAGAAAAVVLVALGSIARMPGGWLFG